MNEKKFKGTGVALVTPFLANGEVDFSSLEKLVTHVSQHVNYLVALGTTAETPTLNKEEKLQVFECIANANNGKLPLVVGIGGNNTAEVINNIKQFPLEKADAILCVSPYYNKPSQEGIYQHFKAIAESTEKEIILYNVPGRTGSNMLPQTTLRLATGFKNIIAIKEASGIMTQCMELAKILPHDFTLLSGDDNLILPQMSCGFDGVISVAANCFTKDFTSIVNLCRIGNYSEAKNIHYKLLDGIDLLFADGNPPGVKFVLSEMQLSGNYFRLPVVPVSEKTAQALREFLKTLN